MIHVEIIEHPDLDAEMHTYYDEEEQLLDIHLFIDGNFKGHLTLDMMRVLQEEDLGNNKQSLIAACIPCGDCEEYH